MERHLPTPLGHSSSPICGACSDVGTDLGNLGSDQNCVCVVCMMCALVIIKSVLLIRLLHLRNMGSDHFSEAVMSYIKWYLDW